MYLKRIIYTRFQPGIIANRVYKTYHLVQGVLKIALLCELVVLSQQRICVLGEQFGRFGCRVTSRSVAVDKVSARLIKRSNEAHFILEASLHGVLILAVDLEQSIDVDLGLELGIRTAFTNELANGCLARALDVLFELLP